MGRGEAVNLGTGTGTSVRDLADLLGCPTPIAAAAREGEIRHSRADVSLARTRLGFEPRVALRDGLAELHA